MKTENFKKKSWTEEEISQVFRVLKRGEKQHAKSIKLGGAITYIFALLVVILGNLFSSVIMVPILLLVSGFYLITLLLLLGLCFGTLFETIIWLFEKATHQIIIAGLFIPSVALINVVLIVKLSNKFAEALYTSVGPQNPLIVGIFYISAFVLPFLVHKLIIIHNKKISF
ncbi:hypothetical protein HYV79_04130 [Candidatus Woesearchaeota archaeon]|nr:hypothetical protein [Candidatus Woesearchaeota archaeon]